ncbi:MAG TPA: HAD-IA family hydrolase [Candidatus Dormibacteraeota bacterium]|nr:HAD-IA family hydrolase [Candidatus Dormibacteraeota bacterium]
MPTNFPEVKVLVFDLDGTLIDSKRDLVQAVNATRRHMGFDPLSDELVSSYVGEGMQKLIERAMGEGITPGQIEEAMAFFLDYYREHMLDHTVTYPGVREGLAALNAFPLAVLTNKPVRFSRSILEGLGLLGLFRQVYGGNSFEKKKPDPVGMNALLGEFGIDPRQAMLVGDSIVDIRTARNAGTWAAGVTYGFGSSQLDADPPDILLDSLAQLPERLGSTNGQ